ncbi:MAG: hypothetical protein ACI8QC_001729 [Planctomycetota bacterium]|jgi:hypothetical protein
MLFARFALLLALAPGASSQVIYVDDSATGVDDGSSWQDAHVDLQSALAGAVSGTQVWVAEGTYRPTQGLDRQASFVINNNVELYGGFAGNETLLADRAGLFSTTILNGDLLGDDGPGFQGRADNSYHLVQNGGADLRLDGFLLRGGNANGPTFNQQVGGGLTFIFFFYGSVHNCTFAENESLAGGGAVHSGLTAVLWENCTFLNNRTAGVGGALWENSTQTGTSSFLNCRFHGNRASGGGGGALWSYHSFLKGCVFTGNSADGCSQGGGAILGDGLDLINCTFYGNSAVGAAQGTGGVLVDFPRHVSNTILWGNTDSLGDTQGAQFRARSSAVLDMSHSVIEGYDGSLSTEWNLALDPGFTDPAGADNQLGTLDDQPWLGPLSPCIDAADLSLLGVAPANDVGGQDRIVNALRCDNPGDVLDMGAYERQAPGSAGQVCAAAPTSIGPPVALHANCAPSLQSGQFSVTASAIPPGFAILAASQHLGRTPFGSGELCLAGPLIHTPVAINATGLHTFLLDLSQAPWLAITSGSSWNFQVLLRDFGAGTSHTSDALRCTFRP